MKKFLSLALAASLGLCALGCGESAKPPVKPDPAPVVDPPKDPAAPVEPAAPATPPAEGATADPPATPPDPAPTKPE